MAVSTASQVQRFHRAFLRTFRQRNVFLQLCNREHEADLQRSGTKNVPRYKSSHAVTASTSWAYDTTRNRATVDNVQLVWGNIKHFNQDIEPDEQANLAANLLLEYAVQQAAVVAEYVDEQILDAMAGEDVSAVVNDLSGTDTTNQKSLVGTATNYVGYDGITVAGSNDDDDLFFNKLRAQNLLLKQANKAGIVSVDAPVWDCTMPPHLYDNVERTLENKGVDSLVLSAINGQRRRQLFGNLNIRESNALNKEYTETLKKHHLVLITNLAGTTYGERFRNTRIFPPGINQTGEWWKIDGIFQNYADVLDNRFIYQMFVRKEA